MPSTFQAASLATPLPKSAIEHLFERFTAQLGSKVADLWAGVPPEHIHAEWGVALADFRPEEIDRGLRSCQTRQFAPTLGEFTRLCRPALDAEVAFLEAGAGLRARDTGEVGVWTHPAVFRAACTMSVEVRAGSWRESRKRWEWALARELEAGWRKDVPPPPLRIAADVRTGPPPKAIREALAKLRNGGSE